jgi:hypothetical protein
MAGSTLPQWELSVYYKLRRCGSTITTGCFEKMMAQFGVDSHFNNVPMSLYEPLKTVVNYGIMQKYQITRTFGAELIVCVILVDPSTLTIREVTSVTVYDPYKPTRVEFNISDKRTYRILYISETGGIFKYVVDGGE